MPCKIYYHDRLLSQARHVGFKFNEEFSNKLWKLFFIKIVLTFKNLYDLSNKEVFVTFKFTSAFMQLQLPKKKMWAGKNVIGQVEGKLIACGALVEDKGETIGEIRNFPLKLARKIK